MQNHKSGEIHSLYEAISQLFGRWSVPRRRGANA